MPIAAQKPFTPREAEVFALVCQGLTNKEVAAKMFIEIPSVKFHLTNIFKKHNVKSRAQLLSKASDESISDNEIRRFRDILNEQ